MDHPDLRRAKGDVLLVIRCILNRSIAYALLFFMVFPLGLNSEVCIQSMKDAP